MTTTTERLRAMSITRTHRARIFHARMPPGLPSVRLTLSSHPSALAAGAGSRSGSRTAGRVCGDSAAARPLSWPRAHATDVQHAPREPLNGRASQPTYGLQVRTTEAS